MCSTKKREEKQSISEILIIAPFTQDSAVVYSLTGEDLLQKTVWFQHDWPFRALLEAHLPTMKKFPCVLLPQSKHSRYCFNNGALVLPAKSLPVVLPLQEEPLDLPRVLLSLYDPMILFDRNLLLSEERSSCGAFPLGQKRQRTVKPHCKRTGGNV